MNSKKPVKERRRKDKSCQNTCPLTGKALVTVVFDPREISLTDLFSTRLTNSVRGLLGSFVKVYKSHRSKQKTTKSIRYVILRQDKARLYTAILIKNKLEKLGWETLLILQSCPGDFLFELLKESLEKKRFASNGNIEEPLRYWLTAHNSLLYWSFKIVGKIMWGFQENI